MFPVVGWLAFCVIVEMCNYENKSVLLETLKKPDVLGGWESELEALYPPCFRGGRSGGNIRGVDC